MQIEEILDILGPLDSPMLPLFLYGGASTGKTRTIVQIFRHLNRPFVYVSCLSCQTPRILFQSVLDQLASHTRNSGNGYSSFKRCDRSSEFVELLRDAVFSWQQKSSSVCGGSRKEGNGKMLYLIFDNVEVIRHWGKNSELLSLLFKIHDITRMMDLGLIYISCNAGPEIYYSSTSSTEPVPIFFPDYTEEELHQILIRNQEYPKLYNSFLKLVLKPFFRVTRRVDELSLAFKPLFQKYCEPLTDLSVAPDVSLSRELYQHLKPHIAFSLDDIFMVTPRFSADANETSEKTIARNRNARKLVCEGLDFHMSVSAKYLLISAFLASRNPATLDASMFDTKGDSGKQKRKRKNSETTLQKKETKAQEMLMKGPGSFSLERLLAIFQCITSVSDICVDEDEEVFGGDKEVGLISDALLQLSTLCDANFITKGGSCPLDSTRYRSSIDEDMISKVARTINFPLSKYLYRG